LDPVSDTLQVLIAAGLPNPNLQRENLQRV
jgi:hypothetical protein